MTRPERRSLGRDVEDSDHAFPLLRVDFATVNLPFLDHARYKPTHKYCLSQIDGLS